MNKRNKYFIQLSRVAVITALYFVLTYFLPALSYGPLQLRIGEAMTVLPIIFPEAIVGLTIGCLISNVFSVYGWLDMVFGTLATLLAGLGAFFLGKILREKKWMPLVACIPAVLFNALILPLVWFLYGVQESYLVMLLSIFVTETAMVYGLGLPFYYAIRRIYTSTK